MSVVFLQIFEYLINRWHNHPTLFEVTQAGYYNAVRNLTRDSLKPDHKKSALY